MEEEESRERKEIEKTKKKKRTRRTVILGDEIVVICDSVTGLASPVNKLSKSSRYS